MARFYVMVDQTCVARWRVETLSQIFEEDPHKHCADRETDYCQPICRGQLFGHILRFDCVLQWSAKSGEVTLMKKFPALLAFVLVLGAFVPAEAQAVPSLDSIKSDKELTQAITALDKQLFDAYNTCDLEKLGALVGDDLEFYHDLSGLATGKKTFLDAIKNNICGKVTRELVAGSLEVYPLHGYGAVEIGVHRFNNPGSQDHDEVGEAKFIHLWQYKDGAWKITRVISYDHGLAK